MSGRTFISRARAHTQFVSDNDTLIVLSLIRNSKNVKSNLYHIFIAYEVKMMSDSREREKYLGQIVTEDI